VTTLARVRKIALGLPETSEQDHHGMISFRVKRKIFATVPDDTHLRVMIDEMEIRAAAAADPDACEDFYWGKRLAALVVDLRRAGPDVVEELLTDAWIRKAPKTLINELTGGLNTSNRRSSTSRSSHSSTLDGRTLASDTRRD
jgi:hypothetical protein